MTLSICFVNSSDKRNPILMGVCNLGIHALDEKAVVEAYQKCLPEVHKANFVGSAADLMMQVTEQVRQMCPGMILLSVNDDPKLVSSEYVLNIEMQKKKN